MGGEMAVYEYTFENCHPGLTSHGAVGSTALWRGSGKTITGVRAKISSGTAAFNLKMSTPNAPLMDDSDYDDNGEMLWHFRAEDVGSPAGASDGDAVSVWRSWDKDQAVFRQTSSGDEPLYKTVTGPGSNEGIDFDGTQYLTGYLGTYSLPYDADYSVFAVIGDYTSSNNSPIMGTYDIGDTAWNSTWGHKGGDLRVRNDSGNEFNHGDPDLGNDEMRVLVCGKDIGTASSLSEWVDGTALYTNESITINSSTGGWTYNGMAVLGRDRNGSPQLRRLNGAISELIFVEGAASDDLREKIEGYYAHKYWGSGQANPLPAAHPYKSSDPYPSTYMLANDIICTSSYGLEPTISESVTDHQMVNLYVTKCQNPGTLTVELTVA